jgi:4-amino-4-deoxy-L-arabinose transferase-like glycosyltransferase
MPHNTFDPNILALVATAILLALLTFRVLERETALAASLCLKI